jgi:DNA-binding transcriptional ArsR family regulator
MENDRLIELKAEVLKALGHPTRLTIVEMLANGEHCVCEINEKIRADHSTISKHLSILKKAGILSDRKQGLNVYYKLEVTCVMNFIGCITSVIESRAHKELAALKAK